MNIIDRINNAKSTFTKSDELIYNYLQNDSWGILRETSTIIELAEHCGVSKSAILRFAKKLGYSGYSEFKYDLTVMQFSTLSPQVQTTKFNHILNSYMSAIDTFRSVLKEDDFVTIADKVVNADKIRICGYNRSGFTAMQFKYRLLNINIESEAVQDTLLLKTLANTANQNEVFFFLTARGNTTTPLNDFIKTCYEAKKTTILVTTNPTTSYKKYATHFILLPTIHTNGLFIDEQAMIHIFIEILMSYISERLLINEHAQPL